MLFEQREEEGQIREISVFRLDADASRMCGGAILFTSLFPSIVLYIEKNHKLTVSDKKKKHKENDRKWKII